MARLGEEEWEWVLCPKRRRPRAKPDGLAERATGWLLAAFGVVLALWPHSMATRWWGSPARAFSKSPRGSPPAEHPAAGGIAEDAVYARAFRSPPEHSAAAASLQTRASSAAKSLLQGEHD